MGDESVRSDEADEGETDGGRDELEGCRRGGQAEEVEEEREEEDEDEESVGEGVQQAVHEAKRRLHLLLRFLDGEWVQMTVMMMMLLLGMDCC